MRVESRLFLILGVFFIPVGVVYGLMTQWHEPLGYLALFLCSLMTLMIGGYLTYVAKHVDARPEDDAFGEIASGAGELGFFPPYSWWPLPLALGCGLLFAGLAAGWWLFIAGIPVVILSVIGWVFEYYRGEHAH